MPSCIVANLAKVLLPRLWQWLPREQAAVATGWKCGLWYSIVLYVGDHGSLWPYLSSFSHPHWLVHCKSQSAISIGSLLLWANQLHPPDTRLLPIRTASSVCECVCMCVHVCVYIYIKRVIFMNLFFSYFVMRSINKKETKRKTKILSLF